jgi:hypothetical protein
MAMIDATIASTPHQHSLKNSVSSPTNPANNQQLANNFAALLKSRLFPSLSISRPVAGNSLPPSPPGHTPGIGQAHQLASFAILNSNSTNSISSQNTNNKKKRPAKKLARK